MDQGEQAVSKGWITWAHVQLAFFYIFMIFMNGAAMAMFEQAATEGYAVSYVQPDEHTFGIWGLIYMLLLLLVLNADKIVPEARTAICTAFFLNGLWLIANGMAVKDGWSYWGAVYVLFAYAASLWKAYWVQSVDYISGPSSVVQKLTVFTPLSLNLAWVTLACIVNFSNTAMNDKLDFTRRENLTAIGGPDWAMGICILATLIASYLAVVRGDFVYVLGTVWALQGVRRQQSSGSRFPHSISDKEHILADSLSAVLLVMLFVSVLRMLFTRKPASRHHSYVVEDSHGRPVVDELKMRFMPLRD